MKITKGDLIINSKPFVFALFQSERELRCDQCFKLLKTKVICYKCLRVMFCSRKCQSESTAQSNHSHECPILATRPLSCMTRLIARVIKKLENNIESEVIFGHKRDWDCLMDHYENIVKDPSVMHEFEPIFDDLVLIFGDSLPELKTVISIYGKLLINSFAIQDELMRQTGRALYLGPSIFDHSCRPSASYLFIGTTLYIKAIKSVSIQDITDIRISYIDEFETTYERQRVLYTSYYFQCDCERCVNGLDEKPVVNVNEDKNLRQVCERIEQLTHENHYLIKYIESTDRLSQKRLNESSSQNDNNLITELVSQLRQDVMPLSTVLEVKIAEFVAIIDRNTDLLLKVIDIFRSYYGECHHRLALKLYLLAIIADKQPVLKRQLLTEAKSIANQITPDFGQYSMNSNHTRSRDINRYSKERIISDSLIDSTLLYRIKSQLIHQNYYNTYKITPNFNTNTNIYSYKKRSRSSNTDYRRIGFKTHFL